MKRVCLALILFYSFAVEANGWQCTHPFFDTKTFPEFNERYFRQSYVKFRLEDQGNTMVIDMYDQLLREGSFCDYSKRISEPGKVARPEISETMLKRIFALFSKIEEDKRIIDSEQGVYGSPIYKNFPIWFEEAGLKLSYGAWWMVDNFGWLEEILEKVSIDKIIEELCRHLPAVSKIKFTFEAPDHCPYQILALTFSEGCQKWVEAFDRQGISLELK